MQIVVTVFFAPLKGVLVTRPEGDSLDERVFLTGIPSPHPLEIA